MTDCAGIHNMEWRYTHGGGFGSCELTTRNLRSSSSKSGMDHFTVGRGHSALGQRARILLELVG
jgi:hypothetical protein